MRLAILVVFNLLLIGAAAWFMVESIREHEYRAPKAGAVLTAGGLLLLILLLAVPILRTPIAIFLALVMLGGLLCLIPGRPDARTLEGASGWVVGDVNRFDERNTVFARNRSIPPDEALYRQYYDRYPQWEEGDTKRRKMGGPLGCPPGRIDNGYQPNISMMHGAFQLCTFLGPHACAAPQADHPRATLTPDKASLIVKGWARHLGADLVGICKVDPRWVYSHHGEIHYGNFEDWGKEIEPSFPFAVVVATAMDRVNIGAAPHTPCAVESTRNYAKGAYITTILAQWFALMGYRAQAEHNRAYTALMVPLAIDAGLGELGRYGYLVARKYGARVRLFATLTDMPLAPDRPISIGAEAFCRACKKCGEACPSRSIPLGGKSIVNGIERWKLNAETCFEFWGKVGTDCSICMGICPFSRPYTLLHRIVRWFVANTYAGRHVFPYLDNYLYGKKWRCRPVPEWVGYPKGQHAKREEYGMEDVRTFG